MAYILHGPRRTLIYCANVRTGSTATADALVRIGATRDGGHHGQPFYIPPGAIVTQTVRCHFEVLNSLWFKGQPFGNFEEFIRLACDDQYAYVTPPKQYNRTGITCSMRYENLVEDFRHVMSMAGFDDPPELDRTHSRTTQTADKMFSPHLRELVRETFREEMEELKY